MTSDELFEQFVHAYKPFIPNIIGEHEKDTFLKERFHFVSSSKQPNILIEKDSAHLNIDSVQTAWPDYPFLVDTIQSIFVSLNIRVRFRVLCRVSVTRDESGKLASVERNLHGKDRTSESWTYFSVDELTQDQADQLRSKLELHLNYLAVMVRDFQAQRNFLSSLSGDSYFNSERQWHCDHGRLLATALLDNNDQISQPLGMLTQIEVQSLVTKWLAKSKPVTKRGTIQIFETDIKSTIEDRKSLHVAIFHSVNDEKGLLLGSFGASAELSARFTIPGLRQKLERVAERLNISPESHRWRELYRLSQIIPLVLLFSRNEDLISKIVDFLLERQNTEEASHLLVDDTEYGGCWLIRTVFDGGEVRTNLRALFKKQKIQVRSDFFQHDQGLEFHFLWIAAENTTEAGTEKLTQLLYSKESSLLSSWRENLINLWKNRSKDSLTANWRTQEVIDSASKDVQLYLSPQQYIDALKQFHLQEQNFAVIYEPLPSPSFHVSTLNQAMLSDITLAFDSCGLTVSHAAKLEFDFDSIQGSRHLFFLDQEIDQEKSKILCEVLAGILNGATGLEMLNRLANKSDFTLAKLRMLKALIACLYQMDHSVSRSFLIQLFLDHPKLTEAIIGYVESTFTESNNNLDLIKTEIHDQLQSLRTSSERLAGGRMVELIYAIVRTSWPLNLPEIALKIESRNIEFLSDPKPMFEIFVFSVDFEGVHLRFGPVSRGGIRWSDRVDDFRVEILDLVHTQRVKNTMIVPDGSKGGFVLKKNSKDKSAGLEVYRRFIRSLLRITDNIVDGKEQHPDGVVCLDPLDPYLVVAADRGTASFSDAANAVAAESNFWISDAFASGGKNGYNHKTQGITARGAWESVKAHFATIGIDPQRDIITAVGIGSMSGDVFGNGVLLSDRIKLIGAFNSKYIFIDPDPDPLASYNERKRLYDEGLGWEHYSKSAMSVGAAVYERDRADLKLSNEAQRAIGISIEEITGDDLIRAILCADVDLLWNGGIGTYVKAQNERNEDVGDSSNDLVRINGKQLRAKVVGEGGNLGFTMHGRYEAALAGVRLNTDAVDNSGGVDMSDHEVNLKILLSNLMQSGAIQSIEDRNKIIRQLEPVMIDQVLSNNRSIQIAIQLERLRLENESSILPIWLNELLTAGAYQSHQLPEDLRQFTSPFLSNLVGWSKLRYLSHLDLAESLPRSELQEAVWQRFSSLPFDKSIIEDGLNRHSLHDTIAKTEIINRIVHHAGPLFIFRVAKQLGLPEETIVHLRLQMERWLGVDQLREKINTTVDYRPILSTILQLEEILERAIFVFPTELLMAGLLTDMISRSRLHTSEMSIHGLTSLVDRIRLDVRQIPEDQHETALQKLNELQADELEKGIRRIPLADVRELRFQGRLLQQLEVIRSFALSQEADTESMDRLTKQLKQTRRLLYERPTAAVALHESFREIITNIIHLMPVNQ